LIHGFFGLFFEMNQKLESVRPELPELQGVRALEETAARLLKEAEAEGTEILREARRRAEEIAAADLPMEEVAAECVARVEAAHEQARQRLAQAEREAAALREAAAGKIDDCVAQVVRIVSGEGR
jgi:membrane protein involved in colicin uptake